AGGWRLELTDESQRAVQVQKVIVRQFLAVAHQGGRQVRTLRDVLDVKSSLLMRILAISEGLPECEMEVQPLWKGDLVPPGGGQSLVQITGNRLVVRMRFLKGRESQPATVIETGPSLFSNGGDQFLVMVGVRENRDMNVVLGCRADQSWTADVDVLD